MKKSKKINLWNDKRESKGITLIALIITIIILVILAAISIRAVYNMGIVGHAVNGTQDYAKASVAEKNIFDRVTELLDNTLVKIKGIQDGCGVTLNRDRLGLQLQSNTPVTEQLTATLVNVKGDVTWESSVPTVATVSNDGLVTAVALGDTVVTAKVIFDGKEYSASCEVNITDVPVTSVNVTPTSVTINKNGTTTLTAEVGPANVTDNTVTWSTGDSTIATVDANGVVTGVGGGTTQITATANDGSDYSASCTVTVNVPVTGLALYKSGENASTAGNAITGEVEAEETITLVPVFTPNDASNQSITWSSNHENIATVDANGVVTGVAAGTATITATASGGTNVIATSTVTVNAPSMTVGPTGKPLVNKTTVASIVTGEKLEGEDRYGNPITIPVGFKVAADSGDDVTQGIVIEDNDLFTYNVGEKNEYSRGNQYVWIPTGIVYTNPERTEYETIIAGRYEFADGEHVYCDESGYSIGTPSKATPVLKQRLTNYSTAPSNIKHYAVSEPYNYKVQSATNDKVLIEWRFWENPNGREYQVGFAPTNDTYPRTRQISGFAQSVSANHGYYIARYEASWGFGGYAKSIASAGDVPSSAPSARSVGQLWNFITEYNAYTACDGLYDGVTSTLANSYAWDTAIVYIQTFSGDSDYSYQTSLTGSWDLRNTGDNGDEVCKINDLASGLYEWTTEISEYKSSRGTVDSAPVVGAEARLRVSMRAREGRERLWGSRR